MKPIPTLQELVNSLSNNVRESLGIQDTTLRKNLDAMSSAIAAQFYTSYLYLADIQRNIFPDTAESIENGGTLERIGQIYLNRNRMPATQGIYQASVVGTAGSVINANVLFKASVNSRNVNTTFILDNPYTLTGANDVITLRATQSGLDSLLDVGDVVSATEPLPGVNQNATITEITTMPLAEESIEVYRRAIIDAIQLEPQGGARTDYRLWSSDAAGVRRVYPYLKQNTATTVEIYVEATLENSSDGNGTPSQTILDNVASVIELDPDETKPISERGRRPIQTIIEVVPINIIPVGIVIEGLGTNTPEIRTQIRNTIVDFIYNVRPFIAGGELLRDKNDILIDGAVRSSVQLILGSNFFNTFVMSVQGNEVSNFTFELGNIPVLQTLTINGENALT